MPSQNSPLLLVVGPTGSGKSTLAIYLARLFGGEVINCDSVQVYRDLDIGSAKTSVEERADVPHHLIDILGPEEELTAGAFARSARECLGHVRLPILAGGTGFYIRSLLQGLSPAAARNPSLRERLCALAKRRPNALYRFLRRANPAAVGRIHPNDHQKIIRAIELAGATPPGERDALTGYDICKLGLNPTREQLYVRLNQRSLNMFERGLLAETEAILARGVPSNAKSLQSLGYKQAVAIIEGRQSPEDALVELQTRTRQYAKRQLTWFRREEDLHWLAGFGDDSATQQSARLIVANFLQSHW